MGILWLLIFRDRTQLIYWTGVTTVFVSSEGTVFEKGETEGLGQVGTADRVGGGAATAILALGHGQRSKSYGTWGYSEKLSHEGIVNMVNVLNL